MSLRRRLLATRMSSNRHIALPLCFNQGSRCRLKESQSGHHSPGHKRNEHRHAYEQCPYSLLARINPSNSMIMQAVSSPSLNVLMGFFSSFALIHSLSLTRCTVNTATYHCESTRQARISQLNKNERESEREREEKKTKMKKSIYLLIGDGSLFVYINWISISFFKTKRRTTIVRVAALQLSFLLYSCVCVCVCPYGWRQKKRTSERDRPAR